MKCLKFSECVINPQANGLNSWFLDFKTFDPRVWQMFGNVRVTRIQDRLARNRISAENELICLMILNYGQKWIANSIPLQFVKMEESKLYVIVS